MNYKILHICPSFNNDLYSQITERQIVNGNSVRVFYFKSKQEDLPNSDKDYVDAVKPYNNIDRLFFYFKAKKIKKAFYGIYGDRVKKYDIIHAHTLFVSGYLAYSIYNEFKIPYVVAIRATDINIFFKYLFYLRNLGIKIIENAKKVIFISCSQMETMFEKYIPKNIAKRIKEKSIVIHNGINDYWIDNISYKSGRPNLIINIIYFGDINKNKNIELTISAIELLLKKGYSFKYTIIGRIYERKYHKLFASKPYIEYFEPQPMKKLILYLKQNDIFCMPSISETFGLSYIEAMSQGLPVIYAKGQGIDGIFEEGEVGFHVNPYSSQDLAEKMLNIMNDYLTISKNCSRLSMRFRWDTIVNKYHEIYSNILNNL